MKKEIKCEWYNCSAPAAAHVQFGLRILDVAGKTQVSELPYTLHESDLCSKHTEHVRLSYFHFKVTQRGDEAAAEDV